MLALAFDPSTTSTGWAVYDTQYNDLLEYGSIKPPMKDPIERIMQIDRQVKELLNLWKPEITLIENLSVTRNARTTILLSGLQVIIEVDCKRRNLLYLPVRPSEWRKEIGIKGRTRADQKANTIKYIKEKYKINVNEDEADAICISEYAKCLNIEEE